MRKPISEVTEAEFRRFPLWRYTLDERPGEDETWAEPLPSGRLSRSRADLACVATDLLLADGSAVFGLISAPTGKADLDEQTTRVTVFSNGRTLNLAGYYDEASDELLNAEQFAAALSRAVDHVFPIKYDVSRFFKGDPTHWRGAVFENPPHPLSQDELIDLIVRQTDE